MSRNARRMVIGAFSFILILLAQVVCLHDNYASNSYAEAKEISGTILVYDVSDIEPSDVLEANTVVASAMSGTIYVEITDAPEYSFYIDAYGEYTLPIKCEALNFGFNTIYNQYVLRLKTYAEAHAHAFDSEVSDSDYHWRECVCGERCDVLPHSFLCRVATPTYLSSEPTCTAPSKYFFSCECGVKGSLIFDFGTPNGHNYTAPTYSDNGTHTAVCRVCGDELTAPCSGGEPSCEHGGYCDVCAIEYLGALGHDLLFNDATEPTCTVDGIKAHYECNRCNRLFEDEDCLSEISDYEILRIPSSHSPGKEADCTSPCLCTVCNSVLSSPRGHTPSENLFVDKEAHYRVCVVCKDTLDRQAHSGGEPSCEHGGYCDVCATEYLGALGHDLLFNDATEPTCTVDGIKAHYECNRCNRLFEDEDCLSEISDYEILRIPSSHSPGKEADCTSPCLCTVCNSVLSSPRGHTPSENLFVDKEAHYRVCVVCKDTLDRQAHSGGEPSCEHGGYCDVCATEYLGALGHSVIGISAHKLPDKLDYKYADTFDPSGMVIRALCSLCSGYTVDSYEVADSELKTVGVHSVKITSGGHLTTIEVHVTPLTLTVSPTAVPDKTVTYDGTAFGLDYDVTAITAEKGYAPYLFFGYTDAIYDRETPVTYLHASDQPYTIYWMVYAEGHEPVYGSSTLIVSKRKAVLTADNLQSVASKPLSPTFTAEGLLEEDFASVRLTADVGEEPGEYPITIAFTHPDYEVTAVNGTYTVLATAIETSDGIRLHSEKGLPSTATITVEEKAIGSAFADKTAKYAFELTATDVTLDGSVTVTVPLSGAENLAQTHALIAIAPDGTTSAIDYVAHEGAISFAPTSGAVYALVEIDVPALPEEQITPEPPTVPEQPIPQDSHIADTVIAVSDTQTTTVNPTTVFGIVGGAVLVALIVFFSFFFPKRKRRRIK